MADRPRGPGPDGRQQVDDGGTADPRSGGGHGEHLGEARRDDPGADQGRDHDRAREADPELDEKLLDILRPELEAVERVATAEESQPDKAAAGDDTTAAPASTDRDFFHALGGWGALLDIGLPWIAFLVVYRVTDGDLQLSLIVAIACAGAVALLRLLRKQPLRNIVGGFLGVLIAAYVANRSGRAEDVYLPGLLINLGYGALYLLTVIFRWPLFGVVYGVLTQTGTAWRSDPAMLKGFSRATMVFVGLFTIRLVVQLPLYLTGSLNALGIAKVALGLPLYALALWLAYVVLRATLPAQKWDEARDTVTQLLRGGKK